jgi:hypothetical protein
MKNIKAISMVAILGIAGSAMALDAGMTQKLQSIYSKMDSLALKKDVPSLKKYLSQVSTPDCVFVSKAPKGGTPESKNRDQAMASMESAITHIATVSRSFSHVNSVAVSGGMAIASVTSTVVMKLKPEQKGPSHTIVQKSATNDTWVKAGDAWKLKISKIISVSVTQDGKLLPGS